MMGRILIVVFVAVIGVSFFACSNLPRVRVLHDPLTPEEHVRLGLAYEVEGRAELAAGEYVGALEKEQGYMPALMGLGNLAFDRGALEEGWSLLSPGIDHSPGGPWCEQQSGDGLSHSTGKVGRSRTAGEFSTRAGRSVAALCAGYDG